MAVSKIEHSGNGKFNTNCGGCCQCRLCLLVDGGGKCNMKCGSSCVSCCQWQCRKLNIVAMGNATRTVEGVVNAILMETRKKDGKNFFANKFC